MRNLTRINRGDVALGLAAVSLFVAAGGPAAAANLIFGAQLQDRSVSGDKLVKHAIHDTELATGAVDSRSVKNHSLTRADMAGAFVFSLQHKLGPNSIGADLIKPDAVGSSEIQAGAVGSEELDDGVVNNRVLGDQSVTAAKLDVNAITGAGMDTDGVASLDFGTIADGACEKQAVAVSGADVTNDVIVVTPGVGFTGSTATASVDADDQFSITVCNLSGGAADPDGSGIDYRWVAMDS